MVRVPVIQTRGLNRACNRDLKDLFKGAAQTALRGKPRNPLREAFERMVEAGTKPNLARLTIARKIAAVVLAMWKTESEYRRFVGELGGRGRHCAPILVLSVQYVDVLLTSANARPDLHTITSFPRPAEAPLGANTGVCGKAGGS